jgi:SAM-dependent methyltransferase
VRLYRDRPDISFYVNAARESGGPVLEIGCGSGRVLIPTARAGVEIVGIDASESMLAICRSRLDAESKDVQLRAWLVHQDMRDFDLRRKFRLVTIPFRPFQHLATVDDQIACLTLVHRHLIDGGRLILDVFNPSFEALAKDDIGEEHGDEEPFTTPDGRRVLRRFKVVERDLANQVNHVELIYRVTHVDGRQETLVHAFEMRYLFRFELEHLLTRCGFTLENVYADFDKHPYGSMYPGELIVEARK